MLSHFSDCATNHLNDESCGTQTIPRVVGVWLSPFTKSLSDSGTQTTLLLILQSLHFDLLNFDLKTVFWRGRGSGGRKGISKTLRVRFVLGVNICG